MPLESITISDGIIIAIGGWIVTRLESICRDFRKVKSVIRKEHPKTYQEIFKNG